VGKCTLFDMWISQTQTCTPSPLSSPELKIQYATMTATTTTKFPKMWPTMNRASDSARFLLEIFFLFSQRSYCSELTLPLSEELPSLLPPLRPNHLHGLCKRQPKSRCHPPTMPPPCLGSRATSTYAHDEGKHVAETLTYGFH